MRIAWVGYLDPFAFTGGGELSQQALIGVGRRRGHEISVHGFLGARPQRALRRSGLHRRFAVDWSADAFVLCNLRNAPAFPSRIPDATIERLLATGRAVVYEDAWVDLCPFDLPCQGRLPDCRAGCDKAFARELYGAAKAAVFVSPLHRDATRNVLPIDLPPTVISRPPIDTERFRPLGLERDIDVLYVGTISAYKGYDALLERFGADRLTFAGPSLLDAPVEGTWLGPVPQSELPELYNRAATFAHLPEWIEPMGRTPVEAALCGCEVVLNERVGVASFPREDWTDPERVRTGPDRFWGELEAVLAG